MTPAPGRDDTTGAADEVARLAAAIRLHANEPWTGDPGEGWRVLTRQVFATAGIELPEDRFEPAWRAMWQSAFKGGNYTLAARRILEAVR